MLVLLTFFLFCGFSHSTFYIFAPKEILDGVSCLFWLFIVKHPPPSLFPEIGFFLCVEVQTIFSPDPPLLIQFFSGKRV